MKFREIQEACWSGYQQQGMKKKGDRMVPNCVPVEEVKVGPEMTLNDLLYTAAAKAMHQAGLEGQPMDYEEAIKKAAKIYRIPYTPSELPRLLAQRAEIDRKLAMMKQGKQVAKARRKEKLAPTPAGAEEYWRTHALPTDRIKPPAKTLEETEAELAEDLKKWFKEKWVRFGPDGKIRGDCARGSSKEGKPKCLPQSKAHALGKKGRAAAAAKKRREDPNPERRGPAKNVATKVKEDARSESEQQHGWRAELVDEISPTTFEVQLTNRRSRETANFVVRPVDMIRTGLAGKFSIDSMDIKDLQTGATRSIQSDSEEPWVYILDAVSALFWDTPALQQKLQAQLKAHQDQGLPMLPGLKQRRSAGQGMPVKDFVKGQQAAKDAIFKAQGKKGVAEGNNDDWYDDADEFGMPGSEFFPDDDRLRDGDYVRDSQDGEYGEIFRMSGDPSERRVRILDRDGKGWYISPERLVAVDRNDPDIMKYFGKRRHRDMDEASVAKKPQPYNDPKWIDKLTPAERSRLAGPNYKKINKEKQKEKVDEKQDACYRKVKSRYKVWPSAYASGALVQCRKKGAANWGNKSKK